MSNSLIQHWSSVFNKSRKPANFAVYCGIFSGYFISDKNRSVLFWDQLYVSWDCFYSVSVFDSVCFSPFFQIWNGKPVITRSKSFPRFNPGEFSVLNMYNYLTPQNNVRNGWNIINMSKRTILDFFQSGPKAKQSRFVFHKFMKWINKIKTLNWRLSM